MRITTLLAATAATLGRQSIADEAHHELAVSPDSRILVRDVARTQSHTLQARSYEHGDRQRWRFANCKRCLSTYPETRKTDFAFISYIKCTCPTPWPLINEIVELGNREALFRAWLKQKPDPAPPFVWTPHVKVPHVPDYTGPPTEYMPPPERHEVIHCIACLLPLQEDDQRWLAWATYIRCKCPMPWPEKDDISDYGMKGAMTTMWAEKKPPVIKIEKPRKFRLAEPRLPLPPHDAMERCMDCLRPFKDDYHYWATYKVYLYCHCGFPWPEQGDIAAIGMKGSIATLWRKMYALPVMPFPSSPLSLPDQPSEQPNKRELNSTGPTLVTRAQVKHLQNLRLKHQVAKNVGVDMTMAKRLCEHCKKCLSRELYWEPNKIPHQVLMDCKCPRPWPSDETIRSTGLANLMYMWDVCWNRPLR